LNVIHTILTLVVSQILHRTVSASSSWQRHAGWRGKFGWKGS